MGGSRKTPAMRPRPSGYPKHLARVADLLQKFPGVGEKAAQRLALFLVTSTEDVAGPLGAALMSLRSQVVLCARCRSLAEATIDSTPPLCEVCKDPRRDESLLCVVAHVRDLLAIEASGEMRGRYFVLGVLLSPLEGIDAGELPLAQLRAIVTDPEHPVDEVLLALPSTVDGDATSHLLTREIGRLGPRVTTIAKGMPSAGEIEYADKITLRVAIAGRLALAERKAGA